ncbi:Calx-beta domain-containing protein [Actinoplanes derwentensis]|uniref:Calx-beta domain-containing protein n=1 Tax=Actinoplanes derwentensis TaxID=113562 RepID=A0A1H2D7A7_9ACTN|nr:Calx-beta domain-containing protein [Actinoplanes derwentensis]
MPYTLWGHTRVRQALATATAAAVGLVPVVYVGSPAYATAADDLTITSPSNWEGGDLEFRFTYTGTVSATYALSMPASAPGITAGGGATLAGDGSVDYVSTPLTTVTFAASSVGSPSIQTITVETGADTDAADETFTVTATNTLLGGGAGDGTTDTGIGTIWAAPVAAPDLTLSAPSTVSENAGFATVQANLSLALAHDLQVKVATGTAARGNGEDAVSPNDYTALASDAVITIAAGATSGVVNIPILDDDIDEADTQYLRVTGTSTVDVAVASAPTPSTVDIGINDNDAIPTVSIADAATVTEGGVASFPVTLNRASERTLKVDFSTTDGTAATPADYTAVTSSTITFDPLTQTVNKTVQTATDAVTEETETFTATLTAVPNLAAPSIAPTLGTATATGRIRDVLTVPSVGDALTITPATNWEGGELAFKLSYSGTAAASFNITFANGTATGAAVPGAGGSADFSNVTRAVSFPASSAASPSSTTVTVATVADVDTADEAFTFTATSAQDNSAKTATGTIWGWDTNDITLSGATKVAESAGSVTVSATSTYPMAHDVMIPVRTTNPARAALAGGDYTTSWARSSGEGFRDYTTLPTDAWITIPANQTSGSTTIAINDDTADEDDTQYFDVAVDPGRTALGGAVVTAQNSVEIALTDNDNKPTLSIADSAKTKEGNRLSFPVALTNPSEKVTSFELTTAGVIVTGAAAAVGAASDTGTNDFLNVAAAPAQTIPQYGALVNVPVTTYINPAATWEGPENVRATIANISSGNATLGAKTTADGVIVDAEAGQTVQYSAVTPFNNAVRYWDPEGNTGSVEKKIYLKFATDSPLPATLNYTFVDGTAKNGEDFVGKAGTVNLVAGAPGALTPVEIPITVNGDRIAEADETFKLNVTSTSGVADDATLGEIEFTIDDDDADPVWTVAGDVSVQEGTSGSSLARIPIRLNGPAGTDATFTGAITANSAVESTGVAGFDDYDEPKALTVTIKAGETVGYFEVPINGDVVYERDETFTVAFTATPNVSTTADSVTSTRVVIGNDDAQPKLTFAAASGPEGGTTTVVPTVTGMSAYQYKVGFVAGSGGEFPATVGTDFEIPTTLSAAQATIPVGYEGPLSKLATPFTVPAFTMLNDDIDEPTETFIVTANEVSDVLQGFTTSSTAVKVTDDSLDLPPAVSVGDMKADENADYVEVPVDLAWIGEATSTVQTVTVPFWTENGTARAGQDYTAVKGELEIPPGSMKWSIKVPILNDWDVESDETFTVRLGQPGPLGAQATRNQATVTVKSDDTVKPVTPTLMVDGPDKGVGKVSFSGMATPDSTVELWGAPLPTMDPAKFKILADVKADSKGWYEFDDRSVATGYAFVVKAYDLLSAVKTVKITQNPSLTVSSPSRGKLSASVAGNPRAAGVSVKLQWLDGKKWKDLAKGTTNSAGTWKGTWTLKAKAKMKLRVEVGGKSSIGINSGWSAVKSVTLK